MKQKTKKAAHSTTDRTAKAPKGGAKKENKNKMTVCQLKKIFKQFSKEIFEKDKKQNIDLFKDEAMRFPDNFENWKTDLKESMTAAKESYQAKINDIENGSMEKVLKHLGIIQDNKIKESNLETALKLIRLLIDHQENVNQDFFFWENVEIFPEQVNALHRIIRGRK